jgi:(p)ppGpp synthase/HD superfamily hydrolase
VKLSDRFVDAVSFAIEVHDDQTRKGTDVTYVSHLLAVASIVLEFGGDEEQAIAGLLHDSLEDSDEDGEVVASQIIERFGDRVERIVRDCSDTTQHPKPPWRERKESYLANLKDKPVESLLVSAADKLHNARSILTDLRTLGTELWRRFNAGPTEQVRYYRTLADIFTSRFDGDDRLEVLARELRMCVDEIERIASSDHQRRA